MHGSLLHCGDLLKAAIHTSEQKVSRVANSQAVKGLDGGGSLRAQICWKWRKVVTAEAQRDNFRAFLDGVQYSRTGILRYERIFGPGFVSTGGLETTKVRIAALSGASALPFSAPLSCCLRCAALLGYDQWNIHCTAHVADLAGADGMCMPCDGPEAS